MTENHKHSKSIDALEALAAGKSPSPQPQQNPITAMGAVAPFAANAASPVRRRAGVRRNTAASLRQIMIPFLLGVGLLLLVLGGICTAQLPSQEDITAAKALGRGGMLYEPYARWLVFGAFPLGAMLLIGAFFFWNQGRKASV